MWGLRHQLVELETEIEKLRTGLQTALIENATIKREWETYTQTLKDDLNEALAENKRLHEQLDAIRGALDEGDVKLALERLS